MDILSIAVGILFGCVLGAIAAYVLITTKYNSNVSTTLSQEAELKALLMQHASAHLQSSRNSINNIENELETMRRSLNHYENYLQDNEIEDNDSNFYGAHASVFLRNTQDASKNKLEQIPNQPKDFSSEGASGLFAGNKHDVNADKQDDEEKLNN